MPKITIPAGGWRPRNYQRPAWDAWESGIKRSLLIWHRRAGKDELSLQKFAVAAMLRAANYWHCLPMYEQARKAIWEAVNPHSGKKRIDEAFPHEIRKRTDNSGMVIEFVTGGVYRVVGSDNPDSLVGAPPLGIAFSEWAISNPSAWGLLQPILLENGGWADFITTPRGRNHVYGMYNMAKDNPKWFCQKLSIDDTHQVSMEQIEEVRKDYVSLYGEEAAEALIQQEYWCSFEAAILGAFYGKEMVKAESEGRIGEFDVWPQYPVHTAWDLGVSRNQVKESMAIWFWQAVLGDDGKTKIRVVDYLSGAGYSIAYYADIIKERANNGGYEMGVDYVPHDARVPEMTSSGKDGKAKLRIEVMIECGLKPKIVTEHKIADGISAVRQVLPRCYFDEEKCDNGIECLRQYQTEWDDDLKTFKKTALGNWASHGADAFRYLAVAFRDLKHKEIKPADKMLSVNAGGGVNQVTLEDLFKNQPKRGNRRI